MPPKLTTAEIRAQAAARKAAKEGQPPAAAPEVAATPVTTPAPEVREAFTGAVKEASAKAKGGYGNDPLRDLTRDLLSYAGSEKAGYTDSNRLNYYNTNDIFDRLVDEYDVRVPRLEYAVAGRDKPGRRYIHMEGDMLPRKGVTAEDPAFIANVLKTLQVGIEKNRAKAGLTSADAEAALKATMGLSPEMPLDQVAAALAPDMLRTSRLISLVAAQRNDAVRAGLWSLNEKLKGLTPEAAQARMGEYGLTNAAALLGENLRERTVGASTELPPVSTAPAAETSAGAGGGNGAPPMTPPGTAPVADEGNWFTKQPEIELPEWYAARDQPNWVHAAGATGAAAGSAALLAALLGNQGQPQEDDEAYLMQQAAANAYGTGSTAPSRY